MKLPLSAPRRARAFTLVEMLLVLVILATLAAIVIPKIAGRGQDAKLKAAKLQIVALSSAIGTFEVDNGFYPKSLNDLVSQPGNTPNWHQTMDRIPDDPWGNPYTYDCPGKHTSNGFDLVSAGPDGRTGTDDDITNWGK